MSKVSYRDFTGTAAENYQRYFVPAIATPVSVELLATADLRPGQRVLDVACGTGLIARLAAEQVGPAGSVTGVDVAPDMIAVAGAGSVPDGAPIVWRTADATALPFPDGSYDRVLCQMGLMFIEDRVAALGQMRRVLAAGGRLAISTPGRIQPVFEAMEQAIIEHIGPDLGVFVRSVFSMHDPCAVARLLAEAGFEGATAKEVIVPLNLPGPLEFLWQYINLTPMATFVAQAPEDARNALERQTLKAWRPHVRRGKVIVNQPMVVATGVR